MSSFDAVRFDWIARLFRKVAGKQTAAFHQALRWTYPMPREQSASNVPTE